MSAYFGNNEHDGYQARSYQYKPAWVRLIDYNPDHRPSSSPRTVTDIQGVTSLVLYIQGQDAVALAMDPGTETVRGMSLVRRDPPC